MTLNASLGTMSKKEISYENYNCVNENQNHGQRLWKQKQIIQIQTTNKHQTRREILFQQAVQFEVI